MSLLFRAFGGPKVYSSTSGTDSNWFSLYRADIIIYTGQRGSLATVGAAHVGPILDVFQPSSGHKREQ